MIVISQISLVYLFLLSSNFIIFSSFPLFNVILIFVFFLNSSSPKSWLFVINNFIYFEPEGICTKKPVPLSLLEIYISHIQLFIWSIIGSNCSFDIDSWLSILLSFLWIIFSVFLYESSSSFLYISNIFINLILSLLILLMLFISSDIFNIFKFISFIFCISI